MPVASRQSRYPSTQYPVNLKHKLFSQVNCVEEFKLDARSNVHLMLLSTVFGRHSARRSTWMDKRCPFVCACRQCAVRRYAVVRRVLCWGWTDNSCLNVKLQWRFAHRGREKINNTEGLLELTHFNAYISCVKRAQVIMGPDLALVVSRCGVTKRRAASLEHYLIYNPCIYPIRLCSIVTICICASCHFISADWYWCPYNFILKPLKYPFFVFYLPEYDHMVGRNM
jgi:hypothetical protein